MDIYNNTHEPNLSRYLHLNPKNLENATAKQIMRDIKIDNSDKNDTKSMIPLNYINEHCQGAIDILVKKFGQNVIVLEKLSRKGLKPENRRIGTVLIDAVRSNNLLLVITFSK